MSKLRKLFILTLLTGLILAFNNMPNVYAAEGDVAIDATNFPDEAFRQYIINRFDVNQDGVLSSTEINNITSIYLIDKGITSLKGIEHFGNLKSLQCNRNKLTSLDVSKNTALTTLLCHNNEITSLDVSKCTLLEDLNCAYNKITSLDVSKNTSLKQLVCGVNNLTSLDISKNTLLNRFYCSQNDITKLDVSKNTALKLIDCGYNKLMELDVSNNTELTYLCCYSNNIAKLDLSNNTKLETCLADGQYIYADLNLTNNDCYIDFSKYSIDASKISELEGAISYDGSKKRFILQEPLKVKEMVIYKYSTDFNNIQMTVSIPITAINDMRTPTTPETSASTPTVTTTKTETNSNKETTTRGEIASEEKTTLGEETSSMVNTNSEEEITTMEKISQEETTSHDEELVTSIEKATSEEETTTAENIKTNAKPVDNKEAYSSYLWIGVIVIIIISSSTFFIISKRIKNKGDNIEVEQKEGEGNDK